MSGGSQPATGPTDNNAEEASKRRLAAELAALSDHISQLYHRTEAAQFGMSLESFTTILTEVVDKYGGSDEPQRKEIRELLDSLRMEDLVLARACVAGSEKAWESLLTKYREQLYEIASSIARDDAAGREIADSLYGDLYGLTARGEQRTSKLVYYTGIGSLGGWLRTVLAQSYIDRYRREQRLVSIDEDEDAPPLPETVVQPVTGPTVDPRLDMATDEAFNELPAEDRMILASYFLDNQTLAEIAQTLRVHESTISRRLEKITAGLHKRIRMHLLRSGMGPGEVQEAFRTDVRDLQVNISERLKEKSQKT